MKHNQKKKSQKKKRWIIQKNILCLAARDHIVIGAYTSCSKEMRIH
jgi:hypothetical protein